MNGYEGIWKVYRMYCGNLTKVFFRNVDTFQELWMNHLQNKSWVRDIISVTYIAELDTDKSN